MFALFAPIARLFTAGPTRSATSVARRLLESAGARRDAQQAEELRLAARAYLSVVR